MCFNTIHVFQYHSPLFNFHKLSQNFLKTKRSLINIKERVMLDMRRLVRQTKKTGELEGKYDARVFILVACRLLPW